MKKIYAFLILLIAVTNATPATSQTVYKLDLGSSFTTPWASASTSGTANNIDGSGVNCTVGIVLTGTGSIVSPYPRVNNSGDFVVQNSTDAMEVDLDLGKRTSYVDITFTFSVPVQNVSFGISDIDIPNSSSGGKYDYIDQVSVSGSGPAGTILPTLTKYNTSSTVFDISANTATGSTSGYNVTSLGMGSPSQDGTMFVNFSGNAVTAITIRYGTLNSSLVSSKPGLQAIAFGNISFNKSFAPTTSNTTSSAITNISSATAISALAGTDDESIASYKIVSIPAATAGVLQYKNGASYTAVTAGLVLTTAQAASLKFDPLPTYTGSATFTYTATDNRGIASNTSSYFIPVTSSTLPVTVTNFSANLNNNIVSITWTTQQEVNSSLFIVEKSSDGINWNTLTTVAAAQNSNTARNYIAADAQPYAVTCYRLKEVDMDGTYEFSKVVKITAATNDDFSLKIFPNPVTSRVTVSKNSTSSKTVSVKVYSSNGILIKEMTKQLVAGQNNIEIPGVNALPNGIYTVTVDNNGNNNVTSARFIKQ